MPLRRADKKKNNKESWRGNPYLVKKCGPSKNSNRLQKNFARENKFSGKWFFQYFNFKEDQIMEMKNKLIQRKNIGKWP